MSTEATASVGTMLKRWDSGAWTEIDEIKTITGPNKSKGAIDVTSLSSNSGYRETIGGFKDGGTVTLSLLFRRDTYEILNTDFESSGLKNYEIVYPDDENTTIEFTAEVTELGISATVDDALMCDATLKITGEPVVNSGSGSE